MSALDEKFLPPGDLPDLHKPFWAHLRAHSLRLQQCEDGHLRFIPSEQCGKCGSQAWTWEPVSGRGKVYTFTVVHRGPTPAYQAETPYVIAHVELEEGPRMISNLIDCTPAEVRIGMPVEVVFDDVNADWTLYRFKPAGEG